MKIIFLAVAYAIACILLANSYNSYKVGGTNIISKSSKQGPVFGICHGKEVKLPLTFLYYGEGVYSGSIYFSNDKQACYLFANDGTEILSEKRSQKKELGAESIPIVVKNDPLPRRVWDRASRHYGKIFNIGLFEIADVTRYAPFNHIVYGVYGPFKYFFPGHTGYTSKDVATNSRGATAPQQVITDNTGRCKRTVDDQTLFKPEYDQIIDVIIPAGGCTWFARKGTTWSANNILIG